MAENLISFSNSRLIKLRNESGKDEQYKDARQKGLILRITPAGNKIFRMKLWDKNRRKTVQMVLGRYPELKINDAREIVADRISDIAHGIDVIERSRRKHEEQTLNEVFNVWLEEHAKPNNKRWDQEQRRYELYIKNHLGNKHLSEITPDVIRRWKLKLSNQKKQRCKKGETLSKGMIHRALITLSSIFGKAAPQIPNPCSQVDKYKPQPRTVFLQTDDLKRFFDALDYQETQPWLKDYLLISLYTGARKSNVMAMSWNQLDLGLKLWMIPGSQTKNSESMIVPLLDQVAEILKGRKKVTSSVYVFASTKSKTGHLAEPKRAWKALLKRAGLDETIRLHDLRRTMGSWQAISGSSTKIIGASLGHKSEQATAHYAHLTVDPVRKSMEKAVKAMENAKNAPDKILSIRKAR